MGRPTYYYKASDLEQKALQVHGAEGPLPLEPLLVTST